MKLRLLWMVALSLYLSLPWRGMAQLTANGGIAGVLVDEDGRPLARAQVLLREETTGANFLAESDARGAFHFEGLTPGSYDLTAEAVTFADWNARALVSVGTLTDIHGVLRPASTSTTVQVGDVAPVLDTTTAALSTTLDEGAVHDLPSLSRRWTDFALLTPAVTPDSGADGSLSFRGIGSLLNNNTVDGG